MFEIISDKFAQLKHRMPELERKSLTYDMMRDVPAQPAVRTKSRIVAREIAEVVPVRREALHG